MTTPDSPDDTHGMEEQNAPEPRPDATPPPADRSPADPSHEDSPPADTSRADAHGGADVTGDADLFGETADEAALRALMHGAVHDLHGSPDALEHLRRAVPLRRQRRRQAALGAAAAVLLVGMAVPAVIHAAGSGGGPSAAPANVASSGQSIPGGGHNHTKGGSGASGAPSASSGGKAQHPHGGGPTGLPTHPAGTGLPAPDCSSSQLGEGASQADPPDVNGRVYGWFRVANVSDAACTVPSGGVVQAVAQGAADQADIQVVDHTQGDAAGDLPASATSGPVVLGPGQDYEVAFAWVPSGSASGGCGTPTDPPTTPTPTDTATTSGGADPGSGSASAGSGTGDTGGAPPDSSSSASVALNHTPAAGAPVVVGPVIQGACAGTVYTTTAIPAPTGTSGS
jgi:hypothetical protein